MFLKGHSQRLAIMKLKNYKEPGWHHLLKYGLTHILSTKGYEASFLHLL